MSNLDDLAKRMRADWDRRVQHDYRFWMSDGYADDTAMWESGKRDVDLLFQGLQLGDQSVLLDIGCGVGRLLKHIAGRYARVIGIDVSEKAVAKARELLGPIAGLELITGSGTDLKPIADGSVDFAYSFAAITSVPTEIISRYLVEIHRVLKPGGAVRLQLYLGEEQIVGKTDTLHLRCYRREQFEKAAHAAGFSVETVVELALPFQVSFKEIGIEALLVTLRRENVNPETPEAVAALLLPQGESETIDEAKAQEIEHWMALNYAKELAEHGDLERAREAVNYVTQRATITTIDTRDLLDRIVNEVERRERARAVSTETVPTAGFAESNAAVLKERFPAVYELLQSAPDPREEAVVVGQTGEGPVLEVGGQNLDHPQKPRAAADAWAKRVLQEKRVENAEQLVVFGLGAGYHIESLLKLNQRAVSVIEPSVAAFRRAIENRDLTALLRSLKGLSIGLEKDPDFVDERSELLVRPQSQVVHSEYCGEIRSTFYGKRGLVSLHPKIAVLGPMQGGTLPMVEYCTRGLFVLKQRARDIDMSGFAAGYHAIEKFAFDKSRLAVMQGTYLEMLSQVVLESLQEKPVDILICMAQAPLSGRALQELRRRGIITVLWFVEDYLRFTYWQNMAQCYDFVFTIQKGECLEKIRAAGAGEVHYLPVACDPYVHTPVELSPEEKLRWGSPISFVGAGYHNRQQVFASFAEMPFKIWGTEWPHCRPFDKMLQEEGRRLKPEEYIKIFNATDINVNLHSSSERDGVDPFGDFVNPRTIELAAAGAFQLVDERTLLPEMFTPGEDIVTFRTVPELKEKINHYLKHPEERLAMIKKSRERALKEHTYSHRLQEMLSIIYSSRFEKLKAREDASPWRKMLERSKVDPELHRRCVDAHARGEEPALDGLVADIVTGKGKLSETEMKLLFLYHVRKQIIRMRAEETGDR